MDMAEQKHAARYVWCLLCLFLSLGCTLKDTPRHSLSELRTALLDHDPDTALKYVDVDSIVDCMVRDIFLKYDARADNELQALGIRAGREAAKLAAPAFKYLLTSQLRKAITSPDETGYFDYLRKASVWYLHITREGDTALVEPKGKSDIQFRMAKAPEGHWRIVEIMKK
jgi:hypothetical protein